MLIKNIILVVLLVTLVGCQSNKTQISKPLSEPVMIKSGLVSGVYNDDNTVQSFLGIPYAAPPVGDLRWKAPQPAEPWEGIRICDTFGPNEPESLDVQKMLAGISMPYPILTLMTPLDAEFSEDCLNLNIWTPARTQDEKLPVLIYIHGGGFIGYSAQVPAYTGEGLAEKGIIMVSINYRQHVFGFLALPELTAESGRNASGNYGIMDQIAAIQWVKDNIAAFGGDPGKITIAGQSAGSISVNIITSSPPAKGLYQRAIGESAALFSDALRPILSLSEAESQGKSLMQSTGVSSLADLRKLSTGKLFEAAQPESYSWWPIVDGYILPDSVGNIYAQGRQNITPLLLGSNKDEVAETPITPDQFILDAQSTYGNMADEFLSIYPIVTSAESQDLTGPVKTDNQFGWQMYQWAKLAAGEANVYLYYFDRVPPGQASSFHTAEVPYAYNNLEVLRKSGWQGEDVDQALEDTTSSYWVNFVKTGDPNSSGLPEWSTFRSSKDKVMRLGDNIGMIDNPRTAVYNFIDRYLASLKEK
jgi:para-nitrobenzyl esterase